MSDESRRKMSLSRRGKIGKNATAWKGGKTSSTRRVKKIIHERYGWHKKVFERDGWKCVLCGSKEKIDAHHIEAVNQIIKKLCENKHFMRDVLSFDNEDSKIAWLVEQPELIDIELKNGQTLCRECHKEAHGKKWGSHECI